MKYTVAVELDNEQITDLLCSALEGSSWFSGKYNMVGGGYTGELTIEIKEHDDFEEADHIVSVEDIFKALVDTAVTSFLENADADDADTVLQKATYGEVVFG
jgi:hypothetical protein